ncbi:MAG: tetratricopeptide repeat protein [candidate division Zixibacteria bacterium]
MEWAEVYIVIIMCVLAIAIAGLTVSLRFLEKPKAGKHRRDIKKYKKWKIRLYIAYFGLLVAGLALTVQLVKKDGGHKELTQLQVKIDQQSFKIDSMQCTLEFLADIIIGLPLNPQDTIFAAAVAECTADSANSALDSALVAIGLMEYNDALTLLDRAMITTIGNSEEAAKIHSYKAIVFRNVDRFQESLASCDTAISYKHDLLVAWNSRGVALRHLGRYKEALASYDTVLTYNPDDYIVWSNRGVALHHLGRYQEAVTSCDTSIKYKRDFPLVWNNQGVSLCCLGRHQEAIASYDTAISYNRDFPLAWGNQGDALRELGRHEEAIDSYDTAISFKCDNPLVWNNRGVALNSLRRYVEAVASYDTALDFRSDDPTIWINRSFALGHIGRYREAVASFHTGLAYKWVKAHVVIKILLFLTTLTLLTLYVFSTVRHVMLLLESRSERLRVTSPIISFGLVSVVLLLVILQMIIWSIRQ